VDTGETIDEYTTAFFLPKHSLIYEEIAITISESHSGVEVGAMVAQ